MKVFKERLYRCVQCEHAVRTLAWEDAAPPTCVAHGPMYESGFNTAQAPAVVDDTVIGGRWCETMGHEPFYYESKSQLRKEAARRGLVNIVRHDDAYYAKQRKMHDEKMRDTGTPY